MPLERAASRTKPSVGWLAIQFGAVFAATIGLTGVFMFMFAHERLTSRVDESLLRDRGRLLVDHRGERFRGDLAGLAARIDASEARRTVSDKGHVIFDRQGQRISGHIALPMPPPGFSDVWFRDGDARLREGRAFRQILPGGASLVIVAHIEVIEDLDAILFPLALALSLTIAITGIAATWLFARQIALRLARTQDAADAIASGDLSRRVPLDRLDGMFAEQAASFNRMLDRMEEMLRIQRQFASNLAHDLRTPLTRLRGLLASDDGDRGWMLRRAERECASIIAIFDALLRLSEIEAGRHPSAFKVLPLKALVEDVAETMEPVIADKGSGLIVEPLGDLWITADAPLIQQLLVNLLENIVLHTPPGTIARVSLREENGGEMAVLTIADDGPGLPVTERLRVVKPFQRGTCSESVRGNGLGLAIAQAIVRFHGGELRLTDNGPGLAVEMRFRAAPGAVASALPAAA